MEFILICTIDKFEYLLQYFTNVDLLLQKNLMWLHRTKVRVIFHNLMYFNML